MGSITKGLGILAIIILPWFFAMFWMHGAEFKDHIIGNEIKNRLIQPAPFSFYYVGVLLRYQLPWSLFFLFAVLKQFGFLEYPLRNNAGFVERIKVLGENIVKHLKSFSNKDNLSLAFCYLWIGICLILFTLLRVQHSRYMLPSCPAVAILTAKMFANVENKNIKLKIINFNFVVLLTTLIFLSFAILTGLGLFFLGFSNLNFYVVPALFIFGGLTLIGFHRYRVFGKMVFLIAFMLSICFASLSGDIIPFINHYPMKKFARYIKQENIKAPVAIYKLGSHRARLGVLTGRTVISLRSSLEIEKFLKENQESYLVIKKIDWEREISNSKINIVMEDQIGIKNRIKPEINVLLNLEKIREILNSTETLYLMRSG